ncbi:hypothetical protein PCANC_00045 [Puccinia coronata f. sp. avenae]|uniref:Uncharacterized protein n=1 Tax=Puccinia coronata f. sp. avenae TaxID=200324 RepID=A0A2N5SM30_9BASI|nr:hypothetical protein PCASD_15682 [Puccinia coronata f. sp. avenae]PLW58508.1 hypothetical protein PCANC_00045 [Puccinia coronata f. sp. avenae]
MSSYVHCQHTSADTAPCRCPVWEAPEDESLPGKPCDTCDHRAEWHLPQADASRSGEAGNCKSSWPNGQPCTCPTWVASEDPKTTPGCALCGHKKGWHRPTITVPITQAPTPSQIQPDLSPAKVFKSNQSDWHTRAQSNDPGSGTNIASSITRSISSANPPSHSTSTSTRQQTSSHHQDLLETDFNLAFNPESIGVSPSSVFSHASRSAAVNTTPDEVQIAAEHIRFILSELDGDEDDSEAAPVGPELSFLNDVHSASTHSRVPSSAPSLFNDTHARSCSGASQSSLSSYEAPLMNMQWIGGGRSQSSSSIKPSDNESIRSASSFSVDLNPCEASMSFSSVWEGARSTDSPGALPHHYHEHNSMRARLSDLDLRARSVTPDSVANKSHARVPSSTVPLFAQTISETYVEELPADRPKHPSEERSGRFAAKPTDIASNMPLDGEDGDGSVIKVKPFQSNIHTVVQQDIPVLDQHTKTTGSTLKPVALPEKVNTRGGKSEAYQTNDQSFCLTISPPPSSTIFYPGDEVSVTIQMKNGATDQPIFSPIEFEHQLQKWKRILFEFRGIVTQNGTTEHEIFCLEQPIHLADQRETLANKTGWQFKLQIPSHTNCQCGPGHLPLPSSCSNSVGHVSYHLALKGKRKTFLTKASTMTESKLFVCLKVKSNLSGSRDKLVTFPQSFRSLSTWIGLNGGHKAAINHTLLTYQVEFASSNVLKILYELDLNLSPDSQIVGSSMRLLQDLSSNLNVTITSLNQLINSHANTRAGYGSVEEKNYDTDHKIRDFRSPPVPITSDSTGVVTWKISGYLQVELSGPTQSVSPSGSSPKKGLMTQLRAYAATPSSKDISTQWILRASIQSVLLSQPINICGTVTELQSTCGARCIIQGIPLALS